jgi:hypothetical protein
VRSELQAMTEPFFLTDLAESKRGPGRAWQGYMTSGTWARLARRAVQVAYEVSCAAPHDVIRFFRNRTPEPSRMEPGVDPCVGATRIAMYVHYSAQGRISEMVRRQLLFLSRAGFAIVFISMSSKIPDDDWQAVRGLCALVVQRSNAGRDFGAWQDLLPELRRRWSVPDELLLVNDSVLGPIHPIEPVIAALRSGGDGLFGLTESLQGGPHLQSYMLLARGTTAVADLMHFIGSLFVSHSKWLLVQMSEIRLARWMRQRGHRVAALFGYDRLVRAAIADPNERDRLMASHSKLAGLDRLSADEAAKLLYTWPLNPTHHLWRVLVTQFNGPFMKRELILRNPGRLPGVADWPTFVPPDAPCPASMLWDHLRTMQPGTIAS